MYQKINFNSDWVFHDGEIPVMRPKLKGPVYMQAKTERFRIGPASVHFNDSPDDYDRKGNCELNPLKFENVTLPHDYIINQEMSRDNNNATGFFDYHSAWYRKHLKAEELAGHSRYVLYFEGATANTEVYFNGILLHVNRGGYAPFEVDISDLICFYGENIIAVHTVPQTNSDGWWYEGAGIFRNVWLEIHDELSIDRYGIYVAPSALNGTRTWNVPCQVSVRNDSYEKKTATVKAEIIGADGIAIAEMNGSICVDARTVSDITLTETVQDPLLWSIESPNLYTARVEISWDGEKSEACDATFGFRTIEFNGDKGFLLNGERVPLNGVCGHGDFAFTGKAVPENIVRYKARMVKEMGANAYRCSHYPQSEEMMDEFDRIGVLVMAETRWFLSANAEMEQLRTLIKRDRNHPCVIMWSAGNEEQYFMLERGRRILRAMKAEILKLDKTRPVMVANDKTPDKSAIYDDSDIIGINYNLDIYDVLRQSYPNKAFVSTECCATGTTRSWYYPDSEENGYISAYDHDTNYWFCSREKTWKTLSAKPWICGGFQWIAFEHRGETVWPRICSQSGAIDLFLQKKDAFYQNRSFWSKEPMVHLLPHWNLFGREGEKISVWAYSNCSAVELFVDGKSYGKRELNAFDHAEWEVEYKHGKLEAVGYSDSEIVARDTVETTGRPVALKLKAENADDVHANKGDIALFTCYCVDSEGRRVPDASPYVRFNCNEIGKVIGTGSDVSDRAPVYLPERRMREGAITVAVKIGKNPGKLVIYANSDSVSGGRIELDIEC